MTTRSTLTDPRTSYRDAVAWVSGLAAGVGPDQMEHPTPCPEFDVRALFGHLVTTVRNVSAFTVGTDVSALALVSTGIADDALAGTYAGDAAAACAAWSDGALLDARIRVPWGEVSGREALHGYLNETLVHGWDLAVATGQDPEADPALVAVAMEQVERILPGGNREHFPFAPPVEPAAGAGPTERLANWSGRTVPQR